jgi:hypothetical protein
MKTLSRVSWALTALVILIVTPNVASANVAESAFSTAKGIVVDFFGPSFVPNKEWWWLYLLIFLPLTYAIFHWAPPTAKKVLAVVGRLALIGLAIAAVVPVVSFLIGVVKGAVFGFINFPIYLKWAEKALEWLLGIAIYVFLIWALIKALFNKSTYTGAWGAVKNAWNVLGGFPKLCEVAGALFVFGLLNRYELTTIGDSKFSLPASAITAGLGLGVISYRLIFRKKLQDIKAIRKTRLTSDNMTICPYVDADTGKPCRAKNDVKAHNCKKCGSPLRFDCECGQKEGKGLSFILDDVCPAPGCGRKKPNLPNVAHTPSIPPDLYRERRAAAKANKKKGKGKPSPSAKPAKTGGRNSSSKDAPSRKSDPIRELRTKADLRTTYKKKL